MAEEEDTGDTFLTDVLHNKNRPRAGSQASSIKNKKQPAGSKQKEADYDDKDSNVDSDEYQDVVYDVE